MTTRPGTDSATRSSARERTSHRVAFASAAPDGGAVSRQRRGVSCPHRTKFAGGLLSIAYPRGGSRDPGGHCPVTYSYGGRRAGGLALHRGIASTRGGGGRSCPPSCHERDDSAANAMGDSMALRSPPRGQPRTHELLSQRKTLSPESEDLMMPTWNSKNLSQRPIPTTCVERQRWGG